MCEIKLLVIGKSEAHSQEVLTSIKDECSSSGMGDVTVTASSMDANSAFAMNPSEYDFAVVDEGVISKRTSRKVLGLGLPIVTSKDVETKNDTKCRIHITEVVQSAVNRGRLREHIEKTTEHINATNRLLASY